MGRVAFAGCKYTTRDCISALLRKGIRVDALITISPEQAQVNQVAGYEDLREFAVSRGIPVHLATRYDLKSPEDEAMVQELNIDALLVIGWERLLPPPVLRVLRRGAFGMHGSSRGLPFGRGRSPLNWSLICNESQFRTSLFRYSPGMDDGAVVGTVEFEINQFDTCKTLHHKNRMAMNLLLERHLEGILSSTCKLADQGDEGTSFYPRRRPEDGVIDWRRPSHMIYNFVRALTRPYPGAFTFVGDHRMLIWSCQPFGAFPGYEGPPGTVLEVFGDGMLLIQTADQPLLITDYEIESCTISPGMQMQSGDWFAVTKKIMSRYPAGLRPDEMEIVAEKLYGAEE